MRWRSRPLAFRLTVKLLVGLGIILGGTAVMQVALQDHFAENCARRNGLAVTEVLYGALHTSMLANKRHRLQRTAQVISERSHNISLRIFNKEGRVAVSSNPKEIGKLLKTRAPTCSRCHHHQVKRRTAPRICLKPENRTHTFTR
ncbi:MAG: hypothetical protein KAI47_24750, partial [Deltaproteobacteria bacterium]|nr:hypothetical protein [Deltaproteobacteria bacterium]